MLSVEPIITTSYTDRGNKYKKSNIGKAAAGITLGAGSGYVAMKGIKKIPINKIKGFKTAKIMHLDIQKIKNTKVKMPNAKKLLQNVFAGIEKLAVKAQIKLAQPAKKAAKKVADKVAKTNVFSKAYKSVIDFGKKAGTAIADKTIKVVNQNKAAAKYAGFVLGAVAAGIAIDYVFNKISAHRADKKA